MAVKKGGLGKGLSAIFLENENESLGSTVLPVSEIEPNRSQPRRDFDEESLRELADSIAAHGVLQPLLVRPLAEGGYQLVAGERRWRASRMAGLFEVPVIIREMTDSEMMQIAMIENLQRENLNPVEEAMGYRMLIDEYHLTQEEISKSVGKSRPVIANALRILSLPKEILDMVSEGKISAGHARALLSFSDKAEQMRVARSIPEKDLTVRDVEKLVKSFDRPEKREMEISHENTFFGEVEIALKEYLKRKVRVIGKGDKAGILQIEFYDEEDLAEIARLFAEIIYKGVWKI